MWRVDIFGCQGSFRNSFTPCSSVQCNQKWPINQWYSKTTNWYNSRKHWSFFMQTFDTHLIFSSTDKSTFPNNEASSFLYVWFVQEGILVNRCFLPGVWLQILKVNLFSILPKIILKRKIFLFRTICLLPLMDWNGGSHRWFVNLLKMEVPGILAVFCVIHRQHLVAENLRDRFHRHYNMSSLLWSKFKVFLSTIDYWGSYVKTARKNQSLACTREVHWLSKGICLSKFWNIFDSVLKFLEDKNVLLEIDSYNLSIFYVAYTTNLFAKFSEINFQLQIDEISWIAPNSVISSFLSKLTLCKQNFGRNEFSQFPILSDLHTKYVWYIFRWYI